MSNAPAIAATRFVQPPRVPGLPLLGSLLDFKRQRFATQVRIAREQGDLARVTLGFFNLLMVSSPVVAREMLVEKADAFKKSAGLSIFARPLLGDGLLTSELEVHKRQRRMLAPVFAHKRMASFGEVMVDKGAQAASRLARVGTTELTEEMMRLTLEIVGKTLFDTELGGEASTVGDALTEAMQQMMRSLIRLVPMPPIVPTPGNRRMLAAVKRLDDVVYSMIRERRASGEDRGDMLGMLLATRDADDHSELSDVEVRDQAMTIMLAGHETTANALAWTFHLLGRNREARDRVEQELTSVLGSRNPTVEDLPSLPLTLQALKESMRLYPPAYVLGREATRDVTVGGAQVARGQIVVVNIAGIHRRPDLFASPDQFDLDRFSPEREKKLPQLAYMPFGAGPRICIGNHFALMEGHLLLATLLRTLRFELRSTAEITPEPLVTLRPKGGVHARVVSRLS